MYDEVLVPIDGSEQSAAAAGTAIGIADAYDTDLHVLHVVETVPDRVDSSPPVDAVDPPDDHPVRNITRQARDVGLSEVHPKIDHGVPSQAVLEYVHRHSIDLVVMGTRGQTGLDRWLNGSSAEEVIQQCPAPVLTVKEQQATT